MKPIIALTIALLATTAYADEKAPYWDDPLNADQTKEWSLLIITNNNQYYSTATNTNYAQPTPQVSFQGPMTFRECHYARARLLGEPATNEEQQAKELAAAKAALEQEKRASDLRVYQAEWCARASDGLVQGSFYGWECQGGKVLSSFRAVIGGSFTYSTIPAISRAECFK